MEYSGIAPTPSLKSRHMDFKTRIRCPKGNECFEAGESFCYCKELHRRSAYDEARERRGLAPLYCPPSMR
jgi:hypothetical protein